MDLNNLNKHQVLLMALLISFVASTATGIITVSLMNQAPPPITQTIEHVIQTTVEKAVPAANGAAVAQVTTIVKEDDATIAAIAKASRSIVRIYSFDPSGAERFAGFGVIATSSTRANAYIVGNIFIMGQTRFQAVLEGGNVIGLTYLSTDSSSNLSILSAEQGATPALVKAYTGATFADSDAVNLGQSVIAVGGETDPFISTGIISSLAATTTSATSSEESVTSIRANISDEELLSNAVLVDLSGNVVGFKAGSAVANGFIPAKYAVALVNQEQ
jgi:hypothetical protein